LQASNATKFQSTTTLYVVAVGKETTFHTLLINQKFPKTKNETNPPKWQQWSNTRFCCTGSLAYL